MYLSGLPAGAISDRVRAEGASASGGVAFAKALRSEAAAPTSLPASRTVLSTDQAKEAIRAAFEQRFGEAPTEETLAILTAQWGHETGDGQSMFNFNFAGLKGSGPSGMSVVQRTREGHGSGERTIYDRFRAYGSAVEGASDYLSLLHRKYGKALEAAQNGDPSTFVSELKRGGYFTGSERDYTASVVRRTEALLGRAPSLELVPRPALTSVAQATPASITAPLSSSSQADGAPARQHRDPYFSSSGLPKSLALPHTGFVPGAHLSDALSRAALRIAVDGPDREDRG